MMKSMILKKCFHILLKQNYIRFYSTQEIRVRFAPSPTGYLHLGGLRTALYNYLFAKLNSGKFILRIEDTDRTRIINGAVKQLQEDLKWVGICVDEGPHVGGDHGPYIQSERSDIYKDQVQVLLDNSSAYHCFCTDKRLDLLRKEALRTRQVPKYDNRCRHLSKDEIKKRITRGDKYCIRFKLLPDCETFDDMIYGNIAYDVALNEGDPVIMKADGYPTYHFANVVDDHFMRITHVLRGVEWQISTTKHILMYRAFNWEPPIYGHLPLLMNANGTKLSKRQGDIQVLSYRDNGIFPQALVNFVTSCGGGFDKEQGLKPQCYSMEELIDQFDVDRINAHSTKIMPEMLNEFNRLELTKHVNDKERCKDLISDVRAIIESKFADRLADGGLHVNDQYIQSILKWSTTRISKLSDLASAELLFLWINPKHDESLSQEHLEILKSLKDDFRHENVQFHKDSVREFLKQFASKHNIAFNKLMKILRSVLSGLKEGPAVAEMIEILGKDSTIQRISKYIDKKNT